MSKQYNSFSYSIKEEILNLWDNPFCSHVLTVHLNGYRTGLFGYVKCDSFLVAAIPNDYTDEPKKKAAAIGAKAVSNARQRK